MTLLSEIARATTARHAMLPDPAVVLAMVSGGADSVALLRLLAAGSLGDIAYLAVLHVNHDLRGADSDIDAEFVASLAASLGVPCRTVRYDVAAYAEAEGLNLEDAGRRIRYRFAEQELDARCAAAGIAATRGRIAVAHTADDRLETYLTRIVTGAGAGGLRSIPAVRGRIIRPLLDADRADIEAYLRTLGQPWRDDATNADTSRQRAWVRAELLPLVEARSPVFRRVAARTMAVLAEEDELLGELASAFAHDFTRIEGGALVIDRALMGTLSRPMARRSLREALLGAFPEASRIGYEHVESIVDGIADDSFARDLPYGLRAEVEYARLRISRKGPVAPLAAPGLLDLPGAVDLGGAGRIAARTATAGVHACGPESAFIDADVVTWPLVVDAMRDGDRFRPFGMEGTKKVGDLLTDAKVPRRRRGAVPIVRDGDRIVWVAGVRVAEDVKVTGATARVAELRWRAPDAGTNELSDE